MRRSVLAFLLMATCVACLNKTKNASSEVLALVDSNATKTVLLHVDGMTCEGCETTISKAVIGIEGVVNVKASYTDSLTTVVFDTSKASIVLISEKINDLGYTVVGEISQQ